MEKKLAIIVLGKKNSGKSNTWYEIFGRRIKTGWKKLYINKKLIDVFVRNGSFEEMGDEIGQDIFIKNSSFEEDGDEAEDYFDFYPGIIFCSVQYTDKGIRTINWFKDNGYYLYIQWLNPGYYYEKEQTDFLEFEKTFSSSGVFTKHSGHEKKERVGEILKFLYEWLQKNKSDNSNNKTCN